MNEDKSQLTEREQAFRATVIRHCKWIRTFDPDYATEAYERYREQLPWLNLPAPSNPKKSKSFTTQPPPTGENHAF